MGIFDFMKKKAGKNQSPAEQYLNHLYQIFQQEPELYMEESLIEGVPGITTMIYRDIPKKGYTTAFTYGLSLIQHPAWKVGRAELCISVNSSHLDWAQAMGYIANKLRGDCPFSYGQVINFEEKISDDSEMDAFFIFAPSTIDKEDYLHIDIGADYKVSIASLYPMYSDEIEVYENIGLEKFWHHPNFDNYKVNRNKIKDE